MLTHERLLTSVGSAYVLLQVGRIRERLVTVSAGVRPLASVGSAMYNQVAGGSERFITAGAREGLLTGVCASVQGKVRSPSERAAAVTALEGSVSSVHCSEVP